MKLSSPAFEHEQKVPVRHTCEGQDRSPELRWSDEPEGTRSYALLVVDPDAPNGPFTHWVLYDLPAELHELPEGAHGVGRAGRNDFERAGWGGPCPPPGHGPHRYYFKLYALDVDHLPIDEKARPYEIAHVMRGHVLAEAQLMGRFEREERG
jgi:hypothetical protein